jgi:hypothetical protein
MCVAKINILTEVDTDNNPPASTLPHFSVPPDLVQSNGNIMHGIIFYKEDVNRLLSQPGAVEVKLFNTFLSTRDNANKPTPIELTMMAAYNTTGNALSEIAVPCPPTYKSAGLGAIYREGTEIDKIGLNQIMTNNY